MQHMHHPKLGLLQLLAVLLLMAGQAAAAAEAAAPTTVSLSWRSIPASRSSKGTSSGRRQVLQELWQCGGSGPAAVITSRHMRAKPRSSKLSSAATAAANLLTAVPEPIVIPDHNIGRFKLAGRQGYDSDYLGQLYAERRRFASNVQKLDGGSGSGGGTIQDGNMSISSDGSVTTASVCPADPAFRQANYNRNTGRLFVNSINGLTYLCTAWFVTPKHVVTAAHCISAFGQYYLKPTNPGLLCLSFVQLRSGQTACRPYSSYRLVKWVTTKGFLEIPASSANDGAVIEVEPLNPNTTLAPQVQAIASLYPEAVPEADMFLDGYPGPTWDDVGCENLDATKRYFTSSKVSPLNSNLGARGRPVEYPLAGCVGQSGGRVLMAGQHGAGTAWGIQTYGNTTCEGGRGMTGVTQITETISECGVCVPCLIKAIEDSYLNTTPSPSQSPSPPTSPSPQLSPSPLPVAPPSPSTSPEPRPSPSPTPPR